MDDDAPEDLRVDAGVNQQPTIRTIPEGNKTGEQVVKSSSAGSKVMVLDTVLKECGLIHPADSGSTKKPPDTSGSQQLELERQQWMQVRHAYRQQARAPCFQHTSSVI